jgi:hypothetical protein
MNFKQITLILTYISLLFLAACTKEPEFEKFGFWIEVQGNKLEIPMAKYKPFSGGTNALKKNAKAIVLEDNNKPSFYYYGDIPASSLTFKEILQRDRLISVDIVQLNQTGAFKITPNTTLNSGSYYTFLLGRQAYTIRVQ